MWSECAKIFLKVLNKLVKQYYINIYIYMYVYIFSSQGVHLNPLKCMCSRPCLLPLLFIKNQCQLTSDLVQCLHVLLFFRYNSTNSHPHWSFHCVPLTSAHCALFDIGIRLNFFSFVVFSYCWLYIL